MPQEEENLELAAANHALEERLAELEFQGCGSVAAADDAEGLLQQANESRCLSDMYQVSQHGVCTSVHAHMA